MLAGEHLQGFGGALVGRGMAEGVEHWMQGVRQSNTSRVNDIIINMARDPETAAAMMAHATPENTLPLLKRVGRRMAQAAVASTYSAAAR